MASNGGDSGCGVDQAEGKERKTAPGEDTQENEAYGKVIQRRNQSFFMGNDGAGAVGIGTGLGGNQGRG